MRNFSQINEAKVKLEIQDDTINYIGVEDLDKYLTVAGKFISDEAKEVINWLKVNNESYLHDLDPNMDADNALAAFYDAGVPKKDNLKELYKAVGKVIKSGRLLEIPVFQTKEQFKAIIDKKISPDEILLDLETEKGRTAIYKKYQPLMYKIVNQFNGKANVPYEDLMSAAAEGLVRAMNEFGKPKKRGDEGEWEETEKEDKHTSYTFGSYAAFRIRNKILGEIKKNGHMVRIPNSRQKKEREEQGYNTKNHTVSGDKQVGHDSEGNGKTLFDYIDNAEDGGKNLDAEDLQKLWAAAYAGLEKKFGKEEMDLFYQCYHLNGYNTEEDKKKKQKDIAAEHGLKPNTLNQRLSKIIKYILSNQQMKDMFTSILELTHECKQQQYKEEDQISEEKHLPAGINLDEE